MKRSGNKAVVCSNKDNKQPRINEAFSRIRTRSADLQNISAENSPVSPPNPDCSGHAKLPIPDTPSDHALPIPDTSSNPRRKLRPTNAPITSPKTRTALSPVEVKSRSENDFLGADAILRNDTLEERCNKVITYLKTDECKSHLAEVCQRTKSSIYVEEYDEMMRIGKTRKKMYRRGKLPFEDVKLYGEAIDIVCDVARNVLPIDQRIPFGANATAYCRRQVLNFVMYALMPEAIVSVYNNVYGLTRVIADRFYQQDNYESDFD